MVGVLGGGGVAEGKNMPPPAVLARQDLPPVLPQHIEKIPVSERAAVATNALRFVDRILSGNGSALKTFVALESDEQNHLGPQVFEATRLFLTMIRGELLRYKDVLDARQLADYQRTHGVLRSRGVAFPEYGAVEGTLHQLGKTSEGRQRLYAAYQEGRTILLKTKEAPSPSEASAPPDAGTDARKNPDALSDAAVELPQGAFGRDQDGQPYGWGLQNYRYVEGDADIPDLVSFDGFETDGNPVRVRLRQEAFDALEKLQQEFEETVPHDSVLRQVGLHLAEAHRSYADQAAIRKARGDWAALPGNSEHHLGTAFDLTNAKYRILYEWFMELKHTSLDAQYVPRAIRHGIIPTAPGETWHYRYVGKEEALRFWKNYREQIISRHSRLMLDVDNKLMAQLRARAKIQKTVSGKR